MRSEGKRVASEVALTMSLSPRAQYRQPEQEDPTEEDLDLDREIEYAFDTEEPMSARPPAGDIEGDKRHGDAFLGAFFLVRCASRSPFSPRRSRRSDAMKCPRR
jgi:hypothetical protein